MPPVEERKLWRQGRSYKLEKVIYLGYELVYALRGVLSEYIQPGEQLLHLLTEN